MERKGQVLKNLIFAADGPKPLIVLRDAIDNVIEIVKNDRFCLVYDRPLTDQGLTWGELVEWWTNVAKIDTSDAAARSLWKRLVRSLSNDVERKFFTCYGKRYGNENGATVPALIPQVYLHYDPYAGRSLGQRPGPLRRQRMDFLLLMPHNHRIVIEIDGRQHYADEDGHADTARYAAMVAEDRRLRLAGYEVYRFGAHELTSPGAEAVIDDFFKGVMDSRRGH